MRVPVIAGGTFKHPAATVPELAKALLKGLQLAWRRDVSPQLSLVDLFDHAVLEGAKAEWPDLYAA